VEGIFLSLFLYFYATLTSLNTLPSLFLFILLHTHLKIYLEEGKRTQTNGCTNSSRCSNLTEASWVPFLVLPPYNSLLYIQVHTLMEMWKRKEWHKRGELK